MATLRVGDPLDKNTDIGAINSAAQLARDPRARRRRARPRARCAGRRRASCPTRGFWFAPTIFTDVSQSHRIAREEIFGPVLSVLTFRTPDEAVEKANNTPYGLSAGVWTEKGSRILWMAARLRAGVVWANTFNRFDPTVAVRRLQGVRLRSRGRPARPGGVPARAADGDASTPPARAQDVQALHRRRVPALGVGPLVPGRTTRPAQLLAHAAQASRKDVRDAVVAARKALPGLVRRDRLQPRPGALPRRRDARGAPRRSSPPRSPPPRALAAADALAPRSTPRSTAGSGTRAGPTSSRRSRGRRTRSPVRTSTSRCPSRPASSRSSRRRTRACSASCPCSRPVLCTGNTAVVVASRGAARCRRSRSPRCSRRRTCPAASSTCSPASRPSSRRGSRATAT